MPKRFRLSITHNIFNHFSRAFIRCHSSNHLFPSWPLWQRCPEAPCILVNSCPSSTSSLSRLQLLCFLRQPSRPPQTPPEVEWGLPAASGGGEGSLEVVFAEAAKIVGESRGVEDDSTMTLKMWTRVDKNAKCFRTTLPKGPSWKQVV